MGSGKSILLFSFLKKAMKEEGTEREKKTLWQRKKWQIRQYMKRIINFLMILLSNIAFNQDPRSLLLFIEPTQLYFLNSSSKKRNPAF